jgi:CubicO group peptidase (beta-lactamase class C family)
MFKFQLHPYSIGFGWIRQRMCVRLATKNPFEKQAVTFTLRFINQLKMNKPLFLSIVAAISISACQPKTSSNEIITEAAKSRIDSTFKSMVDSGRIAGVSALIVEKNKEVYFNSFGHADREANKVFDRNTLVRIFSMTKPITGTALMQLYEKGSFQLDDPLSKYAPEFADMKVFAGTDPAGKIILENVKRPITIRDLTRHTSGFARPEHPQLGVMVKDADVMNKENTLAQMAQKLGKLPLAFNPGDQWSYGVSVDVQAFLVERLSGKPFDQYVRENILDPLGMKSTRYVPEDLSRLASVYTKGEDGKLQRMPDEEANVFNGKPWPLKPGGFGFTSTVDDYMRFARMLVNKGTFEGVTILKPETVKLMSTNQLADSVTERMWLPSKGQVGFGIDFAVRLRPPVDAKENPGVVGEFFWDGAASTLFWVDPVNEVTAVLFVQVFPFSRELHKNFRDAVYGKYRGGL